MKCKYCGSYDCSRIYDDTWQCEECGSVFNRRGDDKRMSPYERTKAQVYATGNKWAIENFNATHN